MRPTRSGEWALGEERYIGAADARRSCSGSTHASSATAARQAYERARRRADPMRPRAARHRRLEGGPRRAQRGSSAHAGGRCASATRTGPSARATTCASIGLVTLPGGRGVRRRAVTALPAPGAGRRVVHAPPPFSDRMQGHFFVPFPPDGASEDEIQKRLASQLLPGHPDHGRARGIPRPPLAPGHVARPTPSRLRQVFRTPYFSEGWALYAERMMREQGFFTDLRHEMNQLRGDDLPRGSHRGRHEPPHGRDELGRGRSPS